MTIARGKPEGITGLCAVYLSPRFPAEPGWQEQDTALLATDHDLVESEQMVSALRAIGEPQDACTTSMSK
jgi:hypothetical protein